MGNGGGDPESGSYAPVFGSDAVNRPAEHATLGNFFSSARFLVQKEYGRHPNAAAALRCRHSCGTARKICTAAELDQRGPQASSDILANHVVSIHRNGKHATIKQAACSTSGGKWRRLQEAAVERVN